MPTSSDSINPQNAGPTAVGERADARVPESGVETLNNPVTMILHPVPDSAPRRLTTRLAVWFTSLSVRAGLLSAVTHLVAYFLAVAVFIALGRDLSEPLFTRQPPLQASLADDTVLDDAAQLELTAELSPMDAEEQASTTELAQSLAMRPDGRVDALPSDALQSFSGNALSQTSSTAADNFLLKLPESGLAVTKGSFTGWTDPANPAPMQNYLIIVEIRLPSDIQSYRLSDLNGDVIGTDNYRQRIPFDRDSPMASAVSTPDGLKVIRGNEAVEVVDNRVQLVIKVPGASRLTKDTIRIRSRRLREDQELVLIFGQPPAPAEKSQPFHSKE